MQLFSALALLGLLLLSIDGDNDAIKLATQLAHIQKLTSASHLEIYLCSHSIDELTKQWWQTTYSVSVVDVQIYTKKVQQKVFHHHLLLLLLLQ